MCFRCDEDLRGFDLTLDLFLVGGGLPGLISQNISHRMYREEKTSGCLSVSSWICSCEASSL